MQVALRAIVSSLAHDSGLVKEVREAFEELEHGHTGSVKNATLLQVYYGCCSCCCCCCYEWQNKELCLFHVPST